MSEKFLEIIQILQKEEIFHIGIFAHQNADPDSIASVIGLKKILEIPEEVSVLAFTPVGYPDRKSPGRSRKPVSEIVCFERYQ